MPSGILYGILYKVEDAQCQSIPALRLSSYPPFTKLQLKQFQQKNKKWNFNDSAHTVHCKYIDHRKNSINILFPKLETPQPNQEQGTTSTVTKAISFYSSASLLVLIIASRLISCCFFGMRLYSQLYVMYFQFSQMETPQPNKEQGTRYNHKSNFFLFLCHSLSQESSLSLQDGFRVVFMASTRKLSNKLRKSLFPVKLLYT